MELTHEFTVPASVEDAWAAFNDLERITLCFPGAALTSFDGETFAGGVKVKLGPISMQYTGTGKFLERDDVAHRAVIEAKGKDKRGNGTAGATVTIQLTDAGDGSTRADVQTDLAVTGKPAQFGRGVMQDVSDKLLGQFIACIEGKIGDANPEAPEVQGSDPIGTNPAPTEAHEVQGPLPSGTEPAPDTTTADDVPPEDASPTPAPVVAEAPPVPPTPAVTAPPARASSAPAKESDDALDLGSTVLPILLRTYGKQVAIGVVVVVAVIVIWRAMSG